MEKTIDYKQAWDMLIAQSQDKATDHQSSIQTNTCALRCLQWMKAIEDELKGQFNG